jgi:hypothetical protein
MGYNRSGTRRAQKEKRFKREVQRALAKLEKDAKQPPKTAPQTAKS